MHKVYYVLVHLNGDITLCCDYIEVYSMYGLYIDSKWHLMEHVGTSKLLDILYAQ